MDTPRRRFGSALLLLLGGSPVFAQTSIELGPLGGYYRPTGSFEPATVYSVRMPGEPKDLSGMAWGGEARVWFGGPFGAGIQVVSVGSERGSVITPVGPTGPIPARVTTGIVQLLFDVLDRADGVRVWLSAGPGLVRHGGEAYDAVGSQADVAAAGGVGGSCPIAGSLRATAGLTALLYSYNVAMPAALRLNGESLQKGSRRDALFHVGVNWVLH